MITTLSRTSKLRKTLCIGLPLLLLLAGVPCNPAQALEALSVTSLSPETGHSFPEEFCQVGDTLLFRARDGYHGTELWKIDGPEAAPAMAADLNPTGSSNPSDLTQMGDRLFFFANNGTNGLQLWSSDGTEAGTVALTSVSDGFPGVNDLTTSGEQLFFFAEGKDSYQLWISDGTSTGTAMVTEGFTDVSTQVATEDRFFALAEDDSKGWQLWTSDGTEEGTVTLTALDSGDISKPFTDEELCAVGNRVYAAINVPDHGTELWVSDGTAEGTQLACDLYEGSESSSPLKLTAVGTSLAFFADAGDPNTYQVYLLEKGTSEPLCVSSLDAFDYGRLFADSVGNLLILTEADDDSDVDLRVLDAGGESSRFVSSIAGSDLPGNMTPTELNGEVCFILRDADNDRNALWKTNGTAGGTTALTETVEGLSVREIYTYGGTLFAEAEDSHYRTELWTSDGTAEGTRLYADINLRTAGNLFVWNDRIYMGSWDDSVPGLLVSDGTASGTDVLASTPPEAGYCPNPFFDGDDRFYFFSGANGEGVRLWTSDGTEEGTVELADLGPMIYRSYDTALPELGGKRYFIRHEGNNIIDASSPELWVTDGTSEGTEKVAALSEEGSNRFNISIARTGDRLVFDTSVLFEGETGLWASDGTPDGTGPLSVDLGMGIITEMATSESGAVIFEFSDIGNNFSNSLWKTDGTTEGTRKIVTLSTGYTMDVTNLTPCGSMTFFRVHNYTTAETELWVTEGTDETTRQVVDINPGGDDDVASLTVLGNRLLFTADDGRHGRELWTSDGTEEGTVMVADLDPEGSSSPTDLTVLNGRLLFSANDGIHGRELWSTDGTAEATIMVCDTYPGDSNPGKSVLLDDELYFTAVDGDGNTNLMKVIPGSSSGCNASGLPALGLLLLPLIGLLKR